MITIIQTDYYDIKQTGLNTLVISCQELENNQIYTWTPKQKQWCQIVENFSILKKLYGQFLSGYENPKGSDIYTKIGVCKTNFRKNRKNISFKWLC